MVAGETRETAPSLSGTAQGCRERKRSHGVLRREPQLCTVHGGGRDSRKGALKRLEPARWGQGGIRRGTSSSVGLVQRMLGRSYRRNRFQTGRAKAWLYSHLPLLHLFEMPLSLGIIPGMNKNRYEQEQSQILITDAN